MTAHVPNDPQEQIDRTRRIVFVLATSEPGDVAQNISVGVFGRDGKLWARFES